MKPKDIVKRYINTFHEGNIKIFIICQVRNADNKYKEKLEKYVAKLEKVGIAVHLPHRDTQQDQKGYDICMENMQAIADATEVHIFYSSKSQGIHFDMGVAFALHKTIRVIENEEFGAGKSFPRMLYEWESNQPTNYNRCDLLTKYNTQMEILKEDNDRQQISINIALKQEKELLEKLYQLEETIRILISGQNLKKSKHNINTIQLQLF